MAATNKPRARLSGEDRRFVKFFGKSICDNTCWEGTEKPRAALLKVASDWSAAVANRGIAKTPDVAVKPLTEEERREQWAGEVWQSLSATQRFSWAMSFKEHFGEKH